MKDKKYKETIHTDHNNYEYITITHDENNVRIYTLKNGLKVFLARNTDAPRIQTYIPVRTGSNNDPADNTGLAHYLEHMMFKGTSKIGSLDWEKEKVLLDEISELYEQHKAEPDAEKKKEIYTKIDEVSQVASQYAIANEYDKAISSLGATGTNAHTWFDETVYKNNIPNNELEKWLKIELERFSELTLRLFHTELESVYEEFNRAQDNDSRLVQYELMDALFPNHPNGQQTTLGKAEHLKNPSMKAIHQYFDSYYVPNNYAMVLVGDLDFEETIQLIDQYFGSIPYRELPEKSQVTEQPMTQIVQRTVKSPTTPRIQLAWRTESYGTREAMLADIAANILSNRGEAGLLDLHINQTQKMLWAQAFSVGLKQYGYFSVVAVPKENQTLDEAKDMVLQEIELLKKGEFPDWMLPAIINDFKLQRLKTLETADGLATNLYDTYIKGRTWEQELNEMEEYASLTKEDVVAFAQGFFKENYVAVYKEKGINDQLIRVENPGITPVKINRDAQSDFLKELLAERTQDIQPEFIDYDKEIRKDEIKGKPVSFVRNKYNDLAQAHFIFPMGSDHDRDLGVATQVLQYLGTDRYSPEELKMEFFKIGVTNDFKTTHDQLLISLNGLEENIEQGIALLQHWIQNVKPDQEIYQQFVQTLLENRAAMKKDKNRIMTALTTYTKIGAFSRFTDVISREELENSSVEVFTDRMKNLFSYPYQLFFYGKDFERFKGYIENYIQPQSLQIPEPKFYPEPETTGNVYFTDYDMVQMEMSKAGRGKEVDIRDFGKINVFNEYFGRGLSSIVFQEIRESKSLAYSAYVSYAANAELGHHDYITTYIGTQPDKLQIAVDTMDELMNELPEVPIQFENARNAALKQIASTRINRTNIFFNTLRLKKLGISHDFRKDIYSQIQDLKFEDLRAFYDTTIKPIRFNTAIIGKKDNLNREAVDQMGTFTEVSLKDIFGH
ncbi:MULTISPECIES: M16 family metallopeptidase [Chryseobacterium]|uniref:Zn-dependent peptidase n=1 Tax=Chryseobacterium camelliae TaxID=1265445 RepID=A0ABU0TK76_9FLAO|nr:MULTISPECIES: M16 family metallopeptidase [Chryseobacterium]MDQ1097201.1 putative Zn-dependent peptidase [Chryseobacterium camelliae]MDQ1101136.1 putative Zn-dependent peptidase [Chryseobacterium sp. SORGH_AS_1048]MDR6084581.1 putative Zn-dependent peptidase [Chryseobacterium sp. SORGH_AS_0909]MDT3408944.1 putative Zn-dependent peptidase [Pseudacidovorax intermedius]